MKDTNDIERKVAKELTKIRNAFLIQCHSQLTAQLAELDPVTDMPLMDVLLSYVSQGWGVHIGIALIQPEEETGIEAQARESGIEIVKA